MKKNTPYYFNEKYEYKTHKKVGADYKKSKTRNRIKNANRKAYKICDTYSEWKKHIENTIRKDFTNREDCLHWLYDLRRDSEKDLQIAKNVQIPLYIAVISLIMQIGNSEIVAWCLAMIFVVIYAAISTILLLKALNHIYFYDDVIEIFEAEFFGRIQNK